MGNCFRKHAKYSHASSSLSSGTPRPPSSQTKLNSIHEISSSSLQRSPQKLQREESVSFNLKSFTFNDLKIATKNFKANSLIGEGGFGCVFKGWIDEKTYAPTRPEFGTIVAIKKLKIESLQGHKEWLAEVNYLGQLRHKNLVRLIGYCAEFENRLLVYEFMPEGSLEDHLFSRGVQPLSWAMRMDIAIGVARGISFLHNLETPVIYRDLKASNILLDSDFNPKLSDFGLARDGPTGDDTHVSTTIVGTHGYAAPEYVATGHLTIKSDIYTFGVVLLELLSGRRARDEQRIGVEKSLVDWAKPFLSNSRSVLRIMDTRLWGQYPKKGAQAVAQLALQCLHRDPKNRPLMKDCLATLEEFKTLKDISRTPSATPEHLQTKHSDHNYKIT